MSDTPDFLLDKSEEKREIGANEMASLSTLMQEYDIAKEAMEKAEAYAKIKKEEFNHLAMERIPEFLLTHGVSAMQLSDGRKVSVKEDISVTIAKADELKFREWLRERNEDDILKIDYSFGRMPSEMVDKLADFLVNNDYEFDIKEGVHPQTKLKYFRELIKDMGRQNLPEWAKVFDIRKTIVK